MVENGDPSCKLNPFSFFTMRQKMPLSITCHDTQVLLMPDIFVLKKERVRERKEKRLMTAKRKLSTFMASYSQMKAKSLVF